MSTTYYNEYNILYLHNTNREPTQTMPITRSKQLEGAQEFTMGAIHASSKSRF